MRYLLLPLIIILLFNFSLIKTLHAQAPEGVNYQAVVRDNLGFPLVNQPVGVRFTIHQSSPTGTSVFQEVHASTTNQFGLINLELGSINNSAFSSINWSTGGSYFLQIEVDAGSGFEDLGASQLLSVPYALFAKSAATGAQGFNSLLDTISAGAACPNGGYQVLLGLDTNANTVLDPGEITSSFYVCNGDSGVTGPQGPPGTSVPDNDWTINGINMTSGVVGNVGIGTPLTPHKLTVFSIDTVVASFSGSNPNAAVIAVNATNSNAFVGSVFLSGSDSGIIGMDPIQKTFFMTNTTPGGNTVLYADSTAALYGLNVGNIASNMIYNQTNRIYNETDTIYTYSPTGSVINVNQGMFLTDSLYILGVNANMTNWVLANDGLGQARWTNPSILGGGGLWSPNGSDIHFNTGNVGIGTTTPTSPLTINTIAGDEILFVGGSNANISAPTQLDINSGSTTMLNAGTIFLRTLNTDRISILNNGNVGIGTSTPTSKLQVSGLTKTDSLVVNNGAGTIGNVLTDDGTGNATWQTITLPSAIWTDGGTDIYSTTLSDNVAIGVINTTNAKFQVDNSTQQYSGNFTQTTPATSFTQTIRATNNTTGSFDKTAVFGASYGTGTELVEGISGSANGGNNNRGISGYAFGNTGQRAAIYGSVTGAGTGPTHGINVNNSTSNSGSSFAGTFSNTNSSSSNTYGLRATVNSSNSAINYQYGIESNNSSISANSYKYGFITTLGGTGVTNYGIYTEVSGATTNWAAFFADGNVYIADFLGIGTTSPTASLDVNGTFKYTDGSQGAGKVLTSNGTGNATWQIPSGGGAWSSNGTQTTLNNVNDFVGIGTLSPVSSLSILYSGTNTEGININYTSTSNVGLNTGIFSGANSSNGSEIYAGYFQVELSGASPKTAAVGAFNNATAAENYGVEAMANGTGIGTNVGGFFQASGAIQNYALKLVDGSEGDGKVLTSDAAGNATWEINQVGFYAGNNPVSSAVIPSGSWQTLIFDVGSPGFFNDGGGYNSATGDFVPPIPGVYQINVNILLSGGNPGSDVIANLRYGAGFIGRVAGTIGANGELTITMSETVGTLGFGTMWWVEVWSTNNCNWERYYSNFSGHLVYAY